MNRRERRFEHVQRGPRMPYSVSRRYGPFLAPLRCTVCGCRIDEGDKYGGCSLPGLEDGPLCELCLAFMVRDMLENRGKAQ
jgi:hypothetical protein